MRISIILFSQAEDDEIGKIKRRRNWKNKKTTKKLKNKNKKCGRWKKNKNNKRTTKKANDGLRLLPFRWYGPGVDDQSRCCFLVYASCVVYCLLIVFYCFIFVVYLCSLLLVCCSLPVICCLHVIDLGEMSRRHPRKLPSAGPRGRSIRECWTSAK